MPSPKPETMMMRRVEKVRLWVRQLEEYRKWLDGELTPSQYANVLRAMHKHSEGLENLIFEAHFYARKAEEAEE